MPPIASPASNPTSSSAGCCGAGSWPIWPSLPRPEPNLEPSLEPSPEPSPAPSPALGICGRGVTVLKRIEPERMGPAGVKPDRWPLPVRRNCRSDGGPSRKVRRESLVPPHSCAGYFLLTPEQPSWATLASTCHKRLPKRLNEKVNETLDDIGWPPGLIAAHGRLGETDHGSCGDPERAPKQLLHPLFVSKLRSPGRRSCQCGRTREATSGGGAAIALLHRACACSLAAGATASRRRDRLASHWVALPCASC